MKKIITAVLTLPFLLGLILSQVWAATPYHDFYTRDWSSIDSRLDSTGLGIGTTNPTEKLHVEGNIAVTGTVDGVDIAAHAGDASAHHAKTPVDDTPDNGDTTSAPTANWAFDHAADASAHHTATVDTNAKTLCGDGEYLRGEDATTCRTAAQIVSDGGGGGGSSTFTVTQVFNEGYGIGYSTGSQINSGGFMYALSVDGATQSSGTVVHVNWTEGSEYAVVTTTTTQPNGMYSIFLDSCDPSTFCRIAMNGPVRFQVRSGGGNLVQGYKFCPHTQRGKGDACNTATMRQQGTVFYGIDGGWGVAWLNQP